MLKLNLENHVNNLKKIWFPLLFAFLTAGMSSYFLYNKIIFKDNFENKILLIMSLGIALGFAIDFLELKKAPQRWLARVFVCVFLILEMILTYNFDSKKFNYTYINLFFMAHLFVALSFWYSSDIISLKTKERIQNYWQKNWDLFISFQASFLVNAVLFLGFSLAITSIKNLFTVQIDEQVYLHIFFWLATVGGTYYLGLALANTNKNQDVSKLLLSLVNFVFPVLQLIYFIILYLYLFKIISTLTLPRGYVGWLVSCLSVLVCLSHLIIHPAQEKSLVSKFSLFIWRYSFILLLPLLVLLSLGLYRRLTEYGFTESRYILFALHIWMYAMVFLYRNPKNSKIQHIPVSLFIITLLTSVGPASPSSVSFWSQKTRTQKALSDIGGQVDSGKLHFTKEVTHTEQIKFLRMLRSVCRNYSVIRLYEFLNLPMDPSNKNEHDTYCAYYKGNNSYSRTAFAKLVESTGFKAIHFENTFSDYPSDDPNKNLKENVYFEFEVLGNKNKIHELNLEIDNFYLGQYSNTKVGDSLLIFNRSGQDQIAWSPKNENLKVIDLKPLMAKLSQKDPDFKPENNLNEFIIKIENENTSLIIQIHKLNFDTTGPDDFIFKTLHFTAVARAKNLTQ